MHTSSIDDDNTDKEIGELIYQSSRTARARAGTRHAETKKVAVSMSIHECLTDQNQSSNRLGHIVSISSESDVTLGGADWDQTYCTYKKSLVPAKCKCAAYEGNGPASPKTSRKTYNIWNTKNVQEGGVCIRHGTKVAPKRYGRVGCNNQTVNGGICVRHGQKKNAATKQAAMLP